jgi:hypothetical protein
MKKNSKCKIQTHNIKTKTTRGQEKKHEICKQTFILIKHENMNTKGI